MPKTRINVYIKNNETGEIRQYEDEEHLEPGETLPDSYIWEEGNYACDCNRELFFERAAKNPDPDSKCSTDRFAVRLEIQETGQIYYNEFEV